jgi:hypothetical protein
MLKDEVGAMKSMEGKRIEVACSQIEDRVE